MHLTFVIDTCKYRWYTTPTINKRSIYTLVSMMEMLADARFRHYAIPAFAISNYEMMRAALEICQEERSPVLLMAPDPAVMITHVGGIDAAIDTTLRLPQIPGGKEFVYTHIRMPMTVPADFAHLCKTDPRYAVLDALPQENNSLWSAENEKYLLENFRLGGTYESAS